MNFEGQDFFYTEVEEYAEMYKGNSDLDSISEMNFEGEDFFYMEVEEYAKKYRNRNRLLRLIHIAQHCVGDMYYKNQMELDALKMLYNDLHWGGEAFDDTQFLTDFRDMELLKVVVDQINGRLGDKYNMDDSWYLLMCEDFNQRESHLRRKFELAKKETEKERRGFVLDKFLYCCGKISKVFQPLRGRLQSIEACMMTTLFLKVVKEVKNYDYSEVLSSEDVVVYGLLCAMATYDRTRLRDAFHDIVDSFGGVVPDLVGIIMPDGAGHCLIDIIKNFLAGHFSQCVELLERQRPRYLLDIYLFDHVEVLLSDIRDLIVAEYVKTFSVIFLDHFTLGFQGERILLDSGGLVVTEEQIHRFILDKKIQGRIEVNSLGSRFFYSEQMQ